LPAAQDEGAHKADSNQASTALGGESCFDDPGEMGDAVRQRGVVEVVFGMMQTGAVAVALMTPTTPLRPTPVRTSSQPNSRSRSATKAAV
jgi:hypothetical protein